MRLGTSFNYPRSAQVNGAILTAQASTYAEIYAGQPNVRTVVDYISRVAVSRALTLYRSEPGGSKEEDATHPAAVTIRRPNDWQGQKELLEALVRDFLIYDNAYLWDMGASDGAARFYVRVPAYAMEVGSENTLRPISYRVRFQNGTWMDLQPEEVLHVRGYSATDSRVGTSPMETLRQQLVEEAARQAQAIEFVRSGMVKGGIIERPLDAPEWSDGARERFERDWAGRLRGVNAGRSPVLEEGMHFVDAGVSPREAEAARNREFALASVCRLYGLHPGLFGVEGSSVDLDTARDAADEDVVVPLLARLAEALTVQLVGGRYGDDDTHFFAFGPRAETSIEKLAKAGKDAVTTVMTIDEYRQHYLNLPPLPAGQGGQLLLNPGASLGGAPALPVTTDRGRPEKAQEPEGKTSEPEAKAQLLARRARAEERRDKTAAEHADLFRRHFRRQRKNFEEGGRLDAARWDEELTADLLKAYKAAVAREGGIQAERLGGSFDMAYVENYLTAGAETAAKRINAQTVEAVNAAADRAEGKATAGKLAALVALDGMIADRSEELGVGTATHLLAFAAIEAGRQTSTPEQPRMKTWIGSKLPDSRHRSVDGESVPLYTAFSNGMQYPGDPSAGAAQTARCRCLLDIQ